MRASVYRRGVVAALDRSVLGRKAERVEPERAQHRMALHRAVAYEDVAERVVPNVALVGWAARVRVHGQHVVGRSRIVEIDTIRAVLLPAPLPARPSLRESRIPSTRTD